MRHSLCNLQTLINPSPQYFFSNCHKVEPINCLELIFSSLQFFGAFILTFQNFRLQLFCRLKKTIINSRLSRCNTARAFSTGLSLVDTTKVEAWKSFLFSEGSLKFEHKEHLVDFVVRLYFTSLCFNALFILIYLDR